MQARPRRARRCSSTTSPPDNLILSGRNIPGLKVVDATQVNVYDVLDCKTLLVSQEALTKLEERLTP